MTPLLTIIPFGVWTFLLLGMGIRMQTGLPARIRPGATTALPPPKVMPLQSFVGYSDSCLMDLPAKAGLLVRGADRAKPLKSRVFSEGQT